MSAPRWDIEGARWPHRDRSAFVPAAGLRWHVQTFPGPAADAPVALLLHGTGAATHSWRDLAPLLAQHFTVVAPDLPGHGFTTGAPRGGATMAAMAQALAGLMAATAREPALIVGHSAGAALAIRMVLDELAAPTHVVGLSAALQPFPGLLARLFPAMARALFLNPFAPAVFARMARVPGETARFLARSTGSRIAADGVACYAALLGTSAHCAGALAMMADWDLTAFAQDLPRLAVPLLLLHGARDAAVPPDSAQAAARQVRNGQFVALAGLGHLAHEEQPGEVAAAIRAFAVEGEQRWTSGTTA